MNKLVREIPTHILLETWLCQFLPCDDSEHPSSAGQTEVSETTESGNVILPSVYKHSIRLLQPLYLAAHLTSMETMQAVEKETG